MLSVLRNQFEYAVHRNLLDIDDSGGLDRPYLDQKRSSDSEKQAEDGAWLLAATAVGCGCASCRSRRTSGGLTAACGVMSATSLAGR
jgi:hypothetical protein